MARRSTLPDRSLSLESLEARLVPTTMPGTELIPSPNNLVPALVRHDTPGVYDSESGVWYLRSSATAGVPDSGKLLFGGLGYEPVTGDWDGNGVTGLGVVSDGKWYLRETPSASDGNVIAPFDYGLPGWTPLAGDWTGNGKAGIASFDSSTGTWYVRKGIGAGPADGGVFEYGLANWIPIAGDWTGSGKTGIGVFDPSTATFYLRNEASPGAADFVFHFGSVGDKPVAGDWAGTGRTRVGVVDSEGTWHLRNSLTTGEADTFFSFGLGNWHPVAGTWQEATPLLAQGKTSTMPVPTLTQAQLATITSAALTRLESSGNLDPGVQADLEATHFVVSGLGKDVLSIADRATHTVHISKTAAGRGWFVDATPLDDSEFTASGKAKAGSSAGGKVDLLTAVLNEFDVVAGRSGKVSLGAGVRDA